MHLWGVQKLHYLLPSSIIHFDCPGGACEPQQPGRIMAHVHPSKGTARQCGSTLGMVPGEGRGVSPQ